MFQALQLEDAAVVRLESDERPDLPGVSHTTNLYIVHEEVQELEIRVGNHDTPVAKIVVRLNDAGCLSVQTFTPDNPDYEKSLVDDGIKPEWKLEDSAQVWDPAMVARQRKTWRQAQTPMAAKPTPI